MCPCERGRMKVFQLIIPKLFSFLSLLHHSTQGKLYSLYRTHEIHNFRRNFHKHFLSFCGTQSTSCLKNRNSVFRLRKRSSNNNNNNKIMMRNAHRPLKYTSCISDQSVSQQVTRTHKCQFITSLILLGKEDKPQNYVRVTH